jgi:hypothetical protein
MNLVEAITLRQNLLTCTLAGCVGIDPLYVMPLLEKLKPEALTDERARRYILAVKEKLPELEAANEHDQANIVAHVATELGCLIDYSKWIFLPCNLYRDAARAIKELQSIAVTRDTLKGLSDWLQDIEDFNR